MYYPCSENKGADQLRGYREADLRLCFRPCKLLVFSRTGSILILKWLSCCYMLHNEPRHEKTRFLPRRKQRHRSASQ